MRVSVYVCVCVCVYVCARACMLVHVCVCVCVSVCTYVCCCIHMCVYMCLSKCMCTCVNAISICDGFVNLQEEYKFAKVKQTTVYKQLHALCERWFLTYEQCSHSKTFANLAFLSILYLHAKIAKYIIL